ncbi:uncharacterized protein METZ01_LOCUS432494, partial [marine metagenome]
MPDESRAILDSAASVLKVAAPVIARLPLFDISPVTARALKVPPTVEAPRFKAEASITSAFPPDPVVFKLTAPVNALVVVARVMSASLALVVKEEVPVTVSTTPCVILPVVAVMLRFPPT